MVVFVGGNKMRYHNDCDGINALLLYENFHRFVRLFCVSIFLILKFDWIRFCLVFEMMSRPRWERIEKHKEKDLVREKLRSATREL